jgi:hypothetical protein
MEYRNDTKETPSALDPSSVWIESSLAWQHAENSQRAQEGNHNPKSQTVLALVPKQSPENQCDRSDDELVVPSPIAHNRRI